MTIQKNREFQMRIFSLLLISLLVACGSDNGQEATQADTAQAASVSTTARPTGSSAPSAAPCEMLTEAMVREYLQPGEIEITGEAGETSQSVYCHYKWYDEPTDEEQQQMMVTGPAHRLDHGTLRGQEQRRAGTGRAQFPEPQQLSVFQCHGTV